MCLQCGDYFNSDLKNKDSDFKTAQRFGQSIFFYHSFNQTYKDKSPILSTVILRKYKSGTSIHAAGVRLRSLLKKQQELGLWFLSTFESIIPGPFQFITMA